MSLNRAQIIGNLGADPDIRQTQDGRQIVNLSIATTESWRDKNSGEKRERVDWHRVVIFSEGLCKVAESYLRKGSKVFVEGQIQTRKWQDQQGNDKYTTEIILQGFRGTLTMLGGNEGSPRDDSPSTQANSGHAGAVVDSMDDEIPFAPEWR